MTEKQAALNDFLAQVLSKLQEARDAVLTSGPDTLDSFADVLAKVEAAARTAADLLRQYGGASVPAEAAAATATLDLAPLRQLQAEVDGLGGVPAGAQAGLLSNRPILAKLLSALIQQLLAGLGG